MRATGILEIAWVLWNGVPRLAYRRVYWSGSEMTRTDRFAKRYR